MSCLYGPSIMCMLSVTHNTALLLYGIDLLLMTFLRFVLMAIPTAAAAAVVVVVLVAAATWQQCSCSCVSCPGHLSLKHLSAIKEIKMYSTLIKNEM